MRVEPNLFFNGRCGSKPVFIRFSLSLDAAIDAAAARLSVPLVQATPAGGVQPSMSPAGCTASAALAR